ncbi:amidase family protein [Cupriavidus necator]|uniref:amidase family protein n=1 Tax=Cupriavidus necator TaxID=106590 RepID=UPI00068BD771|nr:amidase family protein [Cupriavidus necator]
MTLLSGILPFTAYSSEKSFNIMESSVADIHQAMKNRRLSCHELVKQYLDRIQAYDKQGPALNAMLYINLDALAQADEMDREFRRSGKLKPLQCIPTVLKDNYNTADMPTTAGSASLAGSRPTEDAFVVGRLKRSGAVILGKTNLQEFALGGVTVSSLGGQTKNPYDLKLTPGGSSGGTGAALAANFATIGTGSDTANSLRSPASNNSLVSIRPTLGLVSRSGIVPVSFTQDEAGPITRSVADAARMLDVMAGYDQTDPVTAMSWGHIPGTYTAYLDKNGLKGVRIGVMQSLFGTGPDHEEVNRVMAHAIDILKKNGAVVVPISTPELDTDKLNSQLDVQKYEYKSVMNRYLAAVGNNAPAHSLDDIVASGKTHPSLSKFLQSAKGIENGLNEPDYKDRLVKIDALKIRVVNVMAENHLDAMIYPHQKRLPVPIGEYDQRERNGILASLTGFPAVVVPAGFSSPTEEAPRGVPVGLEFLGRPWSEPQLIRYAYGFEQAALARKMPASTPGLSAQRLRTHF